MALSGFRLTGCAAFALGLLLLAPTSWAQERDAAALFQLGNERYAGGDYEAALEAYRQAEATGYVSGPLLYNMGNAYYRLGAWGQAIRYYEKARRLLPGSDNLRHNLELARAEADVPASPASVWGTWSQRLAADVGAGTLFGLGLLFYLAAAGLAGYRLWTGRRSAWQRRGLAVALALGLLLIGLAYAADVGTAADRRAVVVAEEAAVRAAPSVRAAAEADVREGLVLDVLRRRPGWFKVRLSDGTEGWVEAERLGEV